MVIRVIITTMAAMGNITAVDDTCKRSHTRPDFLIKLKHYLLTLLVAAAALYTLFLAWPRLHASLLYLPVDTAISNYWDKRETPGSQLQGLQQRAENSIAIYSHHRYWDGLSFLYFLQGADEDRPLYERRQAFEHAIDAAAISLGRAPSQPRAWFRIARAKSWLKYPADEVIGALKMAVYTGRVDPSLFMARLLLGMYYLPGMGQEGIALMRDQALLAWQHQPREVTKALKSGALPFSQIEYLLIGAHSDVLAEMEASLGGAVR